MRAGRQGRGACGTKMGSARAYTPAWHSPLPLDAQNHHSPTRYRRQVQPNRAHGSAVTCSPRPDLSAAIGIRMPLLAWAPRLVASRGV